MRADNRKPQQLRSINFITRYISHNPASVLTSFGKTKVLVTATTENKLPPHRRQKQNGWLTAEYSMLPGSTLTRKNRCNNKGQVDGRNIEIQRLIGRSLRQITKLHLLGNRTIYIDCDVIQADGGTRVACITGGYVALAICLHNLIKKNILPNNKIYQDFLSAQVAAVSLGVLDNQILTDLCYQEDMKVDTDFNLVARSDLKIIELQATAEGEALSTQQMNEIVQQGMMAIDTICQLQNEAINTATL